MGALFAITNVLLSLAKDHEAPSIVLQKNKRGVNAIALLLGTSGLLITILLSFVLPDTIYEYLTTAGGVLLIGNWIVIIAAQIKIRKSYTSESNCNGKLFKMLFAPYSSYFCNHLSFLFRSKNNQQNKQREIKYNYKGKETISHEND